MKVNVYETIIYEVPANLKRSAEYVGGKLIITNERICFEPHSFNIQRKAIEIHFAEIKSLREAKVLWIIPNGLEIHLYKGEVYKFIMSKRIQIKKEIQAKIG